MTHAASTFAHEFSRFKLWLLTKGGPEGQSLAKWLEGMPPTTALAWYAEHRQVINHAAPVMPRPVAFPTAAEVAARPVQPPTTDLRFVRFISAHSKDEQGKQAKHFDAALNEEQAKRIAALTGLGVQVAAPKDRLTEILLTDKAAWVNAKLAEAFAVEIIHYYPAHILDTETAAYVLGLGEAITAIPGMPTRPREAPVYPDSLEYTGFEDLCTYTSLGLAAPFILEDLSVGPWDERPEDPFSTSAPRSSGMFGGGLDEEERVAHRRGWVEEYLLYFDEGPFGGPEDLTPYVEMDWPLNGEKNEVEEISGTALVARTLGQSGQEPVEDKFTGEAISGDYEDYEATVSKLQGRPDTLRSKASPWDFFAASVGLLYITNISPYHWARDFGKEFSGASPLLESSTLGRTPEDGRWAVNKQAAAFYQSSRFAPAKPPEDGWEWLVYPRSAFAARGADTLVYKPSINVGIGASEAKAIYKALDRPEVREHGILVPFVKALAEHTLDKAKGKEDFFHLIDLLQAAHLTRWLGTSKSGSVRALVAFLIDRRRDIEQSRAPSWEALDNAAVRRQEAEIVGEEDEATEAAAEERGRARALKEARDAEKARREARDRQAKRAAQEQAEDFEKKWSTEAFAAWFERSVVTKNGAPLGVYHGTLVGGLRKQDGAFLFTDSLETEQDMALLTLPGDPEWAPNERTHPTHPRVIQAYLRIRNPLRADARGRDFDGPFWYAPYESSVFDPSEMADLQEEYGEGSEFPYFFEGLVQEARGLGRDGVIIQNVDMGRTGRGTAYLVFYTSQVWYVKDADGQSVESKSEPEATEPAPPAAAPRTHTYGARNRPPGFATAPKGWTHFNPTDTNYPEWTRHGEVVYDRPLTLDEMKSYELHPKYTLAEVLEVIEHGLDDKTWRRVMQYWLPWHKMYQGERREGVMREVARPILDNYVHRADGPLPAPEHARAYYDVPLTSLEAAVFEALERGIEARGGTKAVEEARAAMLRPGDDEDAPAAPPARPAAPPAQPSSPFSVTVISDKPPEQRKAEERAVEAEIARRLGGSSPSNTGPAWDWEANVYDPKGELFATYNPKERVWVNQDRDSRGQPATVTTWFEGDHGYTQASYTHVKGTFPLRSFFPSGLDPKTDREGAQAVHGYLARKAGWPSLPTEPTKAVVYPYPLLPTVYAAKGFPTPPAVGLAVAYFDYKKAVKDNFKVVKTGGHEQMGAWLMLLPQLGWELASKPTAKGATWRPMQDPPEKQIPLPALAPVNEEEWLTWADEVARWFDGKHPSFKSVTGYFADAPLSDGNGSHSWEVTYHRPSEILRGGESTGIKTDGSLSVNLRWGHLSINTTNRSFNTFSSIQVKRVEDYELRGILRKTYGTGDIPEPFGTWIENGLTKVGRKG